MKMLQIINQTHDLRRFALDSVRMYGITKISAKHTDVHVILKPPCARSYGDVLEEDEYVFKFKSRELADAAISIVEL